MHVSYKGLWFIDSLILHAYSYLISDLLRTGKKANQEKA